MNQRRPPPPDLQPPRPASGLHAQPTPAPMPAVTVGRSAWEARLAPAPPPKSRPPLLHPIVFVPPLPLSEPGPRDADGWPQRERAVAPLSLRKLVHADGFELWAQRLGVPLTVALAWLVHWLPGGPALQRVTMGMMIHELGHAVTAWLCGFVAIPMPWVTWIRDERSWGWTILLSMVLAGAAGLFLRTGWLVPAAGAASVLALHWLGALALSVQTAQTLITFGGDGTGMLLAAGLVWLFAQGGQPRWNRHGLRWGWLVIGCVALVDLSSAWLAATRDVTQIPYGMIHGVGLSDASKLTQQAGWLQSQLVGRYVTVAAAAWLIVAASWWVGVRRAAASRRQDFNPP